MAVPCIPKRLMPARRSRRTGGKRCTNRHRLHVEGKLGAGPLSTALLARGNRPQWIRADSDAARTLRAYCTPANYVLTTIKAALNHAFREGKVPSDDAWHRAKAFRGAVLRACATSEGAPASLNACPPGFRRLVRAALESGCRCGGLIRLKIHDFHPDAPSLHIVGAKSGRPCHVPLDQQAAAFSSVSAPAALGARTCSCATMGHFGEAAASSARSWPLARLRGSSRL